MSFFDSMKGAFRTKPATVPISERIEPTIDVEAVKARSMGPMNPRVGTLIDTASGLSRMASAVNFDRAMTQSAVWACVKILTESVASLPLEMYRKNSKGEREQVFDHPLIKLLRNKPNKNQTHVEFKETLMLNLLSGNAYIKKGYVAGELVALEVINSGSIQPKLDDRGSLIYVFNDPKKGKQEWTAKEIWHPKLFGNGLIGMSPISYGSGAISIGLAADNKVVRIMDNGAKPTGALVKGDGKPLTTAQREALRTEMDGLINGEDSFLPVFEGGLTFQSISLTPEDIELLETRRYTVEDVCRFFGVPGVLINDTSSSTTWGSGIEQIVDGFYKFGLRPYLERIEESIRLNLLDRTEWDDYEFEFKVSDLLRASFVTRITANKDRIMSGQATINEVRIEEGKRPIPGGDNILAPVNYTTLDRLISGQTAGVKNEPSKNSDA